MYWTGTIPRPDPNQPKLSFVQHLALPPIGPPRMLQFFFFLLPVGHPAGLDGFVGCIDVTYLRDSLTNIRIRVLSPGHPSLGRMPHSPYYFLGAEYISPCYALPPLVKLCMHVCGECWRVCNWSVCPGLGFHQLFIVPGHRKQCEHR